MNHRMRRIVETLACERRYGIADAKGSEYSGAGSTYKETGADTLRNFKAVAERIGGTPEQVLLTYLLKHMDSITTTVREAGIYGGPDGLAEFQREKYAAGEGIVSRLDDARNYLDLLECLLIDNGHIDPVRDEAGELYQEIGVAAATYETLTVDERAPHQYPGAREAVGGKTGFRAHHGDNLLNEEDLKEAGLVECLDGIWRPAATKDESVKNPGEVQTPIYAQPTHPGPVLDIKQEFYGETGEL